MYLRPMTASEVKQWYDRELTRAFPPDECKPLSEIAALMERGRYEALGLYEEDALLGYATLLWEPAWPGYVLLDYLGVTAAHRNRGLGGRICSQLRARCRDRAVMITEAEAPVPGGAPAENALRCRRLAFYEHCGFRPVYEIGACGARFQALVLGTPPEGRAELAAAHRAIYGPERTDVKVPLGPEECPPPPRERKG